MNVDKINVLEEILQKMDKFLQYHKLGLLFLGAEFTKFKQQNVANTEHCMDIVKIKINELKDEIEEEKLKKSL